MLINIDFNGHLNNTEFVKIGMDAITTHFFTCKTNGIIYKLPAIDKAHLLYKNEGRVCERLRIVCWQDDKFTATFHAVIYNGSAVSFQMTITFESFVNSKM